MIVRQAMSRAAATAGANTPIRNIARIMQQQNTCAVVIGSRDCLLGILTDRDIVIRVLAVGGDPATVTAGEVMTRNPVYCSADEPLDDAVFLMEIGRFRQMPVLDGKGRLCGMLSLGGQPQQAAQGQGSETAA